MKKHIVCLGDSNTHGYCADPAACADGGCRFNENERWPRVLEKLLGEEYLVLEEGLSGRTTVFPDPLHEGMPALDVVTPILMSHEPVDLLIIMLGTNDCKERFSASAYCIGIGLARLVKKAMDTDCWGGKKPNILVICPPPIGEGMLQSHVADTMGTGCVEKSRLLGGYYQEQCQLMGCHFLDAQELGCEFNQIDFMHLTRAGHATLAAALNGEAGKTVEQGNGPILVSMEILEGGKKAVLTYENVGEGLKTSDGGTAVKGFAIYRKNVSLNPKAEITATITAPNQITIESSASISGLAYNAITTNVYGVDINLCNSEGVPAGATVILKDTE